MGFLGVDNKFKLEKNQSLFPLIRKKNCYYGKGTKNGPKKIIKAYIK